MTAADGKPSPTIAYNSSGELYFNSYYFVKLKHDQDAEDAYGYGKMRKTLPTRICLRINEATHEVTSMQYFIRLAFC